jgi:hypothetical protein
MKLLNNKKLVFVLGAGASFHCGYPVGSALSKKIAENHYALFDEFYPPSDIASFQKTFIKSGIDSIDAFLEKTREHSFGKDSFYDLGRRLIAYILLSEENEKKLWDRENNWYQAFFNHIKSDLEMLIDGRIRVITFNYDLSLEQFLYDAILHTRYGHSQSVEQKEEVRKFIEDMNIIHIYGQLGHLRWQDNAKEENKYHYRKYGALRDIGDADEKMRLIGSCAKEINLMRLEEIEESSCILKMPIKYLSEADYISFLGFGYNDLNMQRLFGNVTFTTDIKYFLQGFHMHEAQRFLVLRWLPIPNHKRCNVVWSEYEDDIVTFMNKKFDFWYGI